MVWRQRAMNTDNELALIGTHEDRSIDHSYPRDIKFLAAQELNAINSLTG
jgi:hypothetical protein